MYYCTIRCYKYNKQIFHVDVPWWHMETMREKYPFEEVVLGGETDYHLQVDGAKLREIHEAHLPRGYQAKEGEFVPAFQKVNKFKEGQIETIIQSASAYSKVIIDLWFWSSGY